MSRKQKIIIGTRRSSLALAQAEILRQAILKAGIAQEVSILELTSEGDRKQGTLAANNGDKRDWIAGIEESVLSGEVDLAVHSAKDVPVSVAEGSDVSSILQREQPYDLLLSERPLAGISALPEGAVVGTASLRRKAQLLRLRPDLKVKTLRGNVTTRIEALSRKDQGLAAIILAEAGLKRLAIDNIAKCRLSCSDFLPCVAQGTLCIQYRVADADLVKDLQALIDPDTELAFRVEREVVRVLGADCGSKLGVFAEVVDSRSLSLRVRVISESGDEMIELKLQEPLADTDSHLRQAQDLALKMLALGAARFL